MLAKEYLEVLRAGDEAAWSGLDWRVPVYIMFTSAFSDCLPIWHRQITPQGIIFRRPDQYGTNTMVNQFCRGYVMSIQQLCDQAFPGWPLQAAIKDGATGSYIEIRVTSPERLTSYDEVAEVIGRHPDPWVPMTETWSDWDLDVREQAALSYVIRVTLGEAREDVSGWGEAEGPLSTPDPEPRLSPERLSPEPEQSPRINATELARELNISVRNMQRYMAGQRGIPVEVLNMVLQARPDLDPRTLVAFLAEKRSGDEEILLN